MTWNPTLTHRDSNPPPPSPRPAASAISITGRIGARRIPAGKRNRAQRAVVRSLFRAAVAFAAVVTLFAVPSGIASFIGVPA